MALLVVLTLVLAAAVVSDVRSRRIPNALTGAGALAAAACGAGGDGRRVAAGAGVAAFLGAAALVRPDGMGLGDAKLAGVMGLCLGPPVFAALLAACVA